MNTNFLDALKQRRTIYNLGKNVTLPETDINHLIKSAIRESPTAFNNQTLRAVILYGEKHDQLWDIVANRLKSEVPTEEIYAGTKQKVDSFKAGFGTILYFTDQSVVADYEKQVPLYATNFEAWAEQGLGGAQQNVWTALSENKIGGSLQHYNPLIDGEVRIAFDIPTNWVLRAQMPFGSIEAPAAAKTYLEDDKRFRVLK
ncbi:nitroreductase family protein [Pediococcus inopinatus]|uniref:nitroreductase family protein n=1 Tax=Pediococcus inopinatus TaxID=114090 RepID=UPI002B260FCD|nr:nitroreductase family protein [Pediococcus inopinatus]WPC17070.1 nitroreductase family protein [Pediococcus inopinatus]WPC19809.1 nitroreductase family protein [Pediococcus inopinatus]